MNVDEEGCRIYLAGVVNIFLWTLKTLWSPISIFELESLSYDLSSKPPILKVRDLYVDSFRDIRYFPEIRDSINDFNWTSEDCSSWWSFHWSRSNWRSWSKVSYGTKCISTCIRETFKKALATMLKGHEIGARQLQHMQGVSQRDLLLERYGQGSYWVH